jgi:hypothetical protein
MEFINLGEPKKIRIKEGIRRIWVTIKTNEKIDIPEERGLSNGLTPVKEVSKEIESSVTEGQIGQVKVETKQFSKPKKKKNAKKK